MRFTAASATLKERLQEATGEAAIKIREMIIGSLPRNSQNLILPRTHKEATEIAGEVKFWSRELGRYMLGQLYERGPTSSVIVDSYGVTVTIPNRDIYPVDAEVPKR